ncbi:MULTISPECIES: RNA-binding S4 domain-containing protein [Actinomyces]|uniref:RNA-binding S4 domain-containing protein n=2 Tax=Actinomyces TaxID=1654 RepID=A0A853EGZ1_9ACTO|nr:MULTISPECIES: RNA-binding S4 domain-containing protein [Actinomyces]MBF0696261.1 RNA-binding S4 domain-containing protein [Actinomyces bowdenii]MCR2052625.1 RNA-binding S4 domain-containing protein [Actinomyces bowdenii]NYS68434.1 RNA-binding S4 domain-containing protein [Actinomyces bowdenii]
MTDPTPTTIPVRGQIKLGQFLKLAGLVEDGGEARIAIQSGDVRVNGQVETRRGHHLDNGDAVSIELPGAVVTAVVAMIDDGA